MGSVWYICYLLITLAAFISAASLKDSLQSPDGQAVSQTSEDINPEQISLESSTGIPYTTKHTIITGSSTTESSTITHKPTTAKENLSSFSNTTLQSKRTSDIQSTVPTTEASRPEHFDGDICTCNNTKKILCSLQCNGVDNCGDGSDEYESDCPNPCPDAFKCANSTCIDKSLRCNSFFDCLDKSDEQDCPKYCPGFTCGNGKCISLLYKCDEEDDCGDNTDERDCSPENSCSENQNCTFCYRRCSDSGKCLHYDKICDNVNDCDDESDEEDCYTLFGIRHGVIVFGVIGSCLLLAILIILMVSVTRNAKEDY